MEAMAQQVALRNVATAELQTIEPKCAHAGVKAVRNAETRVTDMVDMRYTIKKSMSI